MKRLAVLVCLLLAVGCVAPPRYVPPFDPIDLGDDPEIDGSEVVLTSPTDQAAFLDLLCAALRSGRSGRDALRQARAAWLGYTPSVAAGDASSP